MRTKVRTRLLKFTMAMEIVMAITILGAILASIALLICGSVEKFCCQWESFSIDAFMANAFLIVMGIEFVKMLMLHTYGAVIDVLLFAIARQMIISHEEPMQTLMSVGAVAGIFAIKKYLYTGERWESGQKDRPCSFRRRGDPEPPAFLFRSLPLPVWPEEDEDQAHTAIKIKQ